MNKHPDYQNTKNTYRIDGIIWWIEDHVNIRVPIPLCPKHFLKMEPSLEYTSVSEARSLWCAECKKPFKIPRAFGGEKRYIIDKLDSKIFRQMKIINIDDEAIPIAKDEIRDPNSPYWVESRLVKSKSGKRLVIYAGERGNKNKTQIFVEPGNRRMSFDHTNHHPTDIFVKLEAVFEDGTKSIIDKSTQKEKLRK